MTYHDFIYMKYVSSGTAREEMGHVGSCSNARLHWSNLALQGNERSSGEYIHGQENSVSFNSVRHNDGAHVHIQQRGGDTTTPTGTQEHRAERNERMEVVINGKLGERFRGYRLVSTG